MSSEVMPLSALVGAKAFLRSEVESEAGRAAGFHISGSKPNSLMLVLSSV